MYLKKWHWLLDIGECRTSQLNSGLDKKILIAEVKRQQKRYSKDKLIEKSHNLLKKLNLKGYDIEYRGFSLDNLIETMNEYRA